MARYRKKPVVIEAALFDGELVGEPNGNGGVIPLTCPDWFPAVVKELGLGSQVQPGEIACAGNELLIGTLEGTMRAKPGDWIICGVSGEIYPCKPDIFAQTYEPEQ